MRREWTGAIRKAGGHAGDVAVVLSRLIRATQNHVLHRAPVEIRITRLQGSEQNRGKVVRVDGSEGTTVAANRSANGVAKKCIHVGLSVCWVEIAGQNSTITHLKDTSIF